MLVVDVGWVHKPVKYKLVNRRFARNFGSKESQVHLRLACTPEASEDGGSKKKVTAVDIVRASAKLTDGWSKLAAPLTEEADPYMFAYKLST